jgi:hypothetical protein
MKSQSNATAKTNFLLGPETTSNFLDEEGDGWLDEDDEEDVKNHRRSVIGNSPWTVRVQR